MGPTSYDTLTYDNGNICLLGALLQAAQEKWLTLTEASGTSPYPSCKNFWNNWFHQAHKEYGGGGGLSGQWLINAAYEDERRVCSEITK